MIKRIVHYVGYASLSTMLVVCANEKRTGHSKETQLGKKAKQRLANAKRTGEGEAPIALSLVSVVFPQGPGAGPR